MIERGERLRLAAKRITRAASLANEAVSTLIATSRSSRGQHRHWVRPRSRCRSRQHVIDEIDADRTGRA